MKHDMYRASTKDGVEGLSVFMEDDGEWWGWNAERDPRVGHVRGEAHEGGRDGDGVPRSAPPQGVKASPPPPSPVVHPV